MELQILDSDYVIVNDRPIIRLFCNTIEGESVCVTVSGVRPYFYVHTERHDELRERAAAISGIEVEETERYLPVTYHDKKSKVFKIIGTNPAKVPEIREEFRDLGNLYESDILFPYRYMSDQGIGSMSWIRVEGRPIKTDVVKTSCIEAKSIERIDRDENAPLKILSFDMETNQPMDRGPMPGEDPIIMISMAFSEPYRGKDTSVIVARKIRDYEDVSSFNDEKEMLEKFMEIIDDYDPDVITGYNINGFDMPALLGRMEKFGVRKTMGRVKDKQAWCKMIGQLPRVSVTGRTIADCYAIVKKNAAQDHRFKFRRFNLNTVAEGLLGEEKHDMDWKKMYKMYLDDEGIKTVIDYARQDAILPLKMMDKANLLGQFVAMSKLCGISVQDVLDGGQGPKIDQYLLTELNQRGFMLPEKPRETVDGDYEGGLVLEPKKGLHTEGCILVLDFKALYPSVIRTYNICPTTLTEREDISEKGPSGARFVRGDVREGIVPNILGRLLEARAAVKKEMRNASGDLEKVLDSKQFALKIMANSFYGYLGYARARIYRPEIAASITAYARELLKSTTEVLEAKGLEVIYGDTDSVMVHIDTKNLDEAKKIGDDLASEITDKLPGILELEFEKVFRTFLIIAKKRYAAWSFEPKGEGEWKDKIDMKGIETVRRDWCPIVSETQLKVLEIILKEGDVKKAMEVVKDEVQNIRDGNVDPARLAITKGITKKLEAYDGKLPHIETAKKIAQRDPSQAPTTGQRISYVILEGKGMLSDKAEDPGYAEAHGLKIDSEYYIENQLIPPLERIFSAIEVSKDELLGNGRQVNLHDMLSGKKRKENHDVSVKRNPKTSVVKKMEGFVCGDCSREYSMPTLSGRCGCGGEIFASGGGVIGSKVVV